MKTEEIFEAYNDYILPTYSKVPVIFVKGKGSKLWDVNNRPFIDLFPGWGAANLGHCHPKVMQAVRDQVSKLIFVPNNYYNLPQAKLAKELAHLSFPSKAFFCNSGAEANEAAIKYSRKFGQGRYEIISFENSFHGRTLAALAATGQKKYQEGFSPLPEGFKYAVFNRIDSVLAQIGDKTAAIMLELIQGEGGINVADIDFVRKLRRLCDERGLLLIIDEVQTGIGRTGKFFCYQHYGIRPDIVTLAKSIAGGLPMGVMLVRIGISEALTPGTHASTFGGGHVIARAALAVLKAVQEENLLDKAAKTGEYLFSKLNELKTKFTIIKDVRGMGLMCGVELTVPGKLIVEECFKRSLLINCTHENVIRILPALNIDKKLLDKGISILVEVLKIYSKKKDTKE